LAKKVSLSLLEDPRPAKKPTLESARSRLGGRASDVPASVEDPTIVAKGLAPGKVVSYALPNGKRRAGVVVYAGSDEVHVLLDPMRLRRVEPAELSGHDVARDGVLDDELTRLAADAHVFGLLAEGQTIRYADEEGTLVIGKLVEKCRWGALVAREDGAVVAVGFRKLWPAPPAVGAES
jgi:hypothetical protein